jgi:hypothetical protein
MRRDAILLTMFVVIVGYMGASLGILTYWSIQNYPDVAMANDILGEEATSDSRREVLNELRDDWRTSITGLAGPITITPGFALLGALVGYVAGSRNSTGAQV